MKKYLIQKVILVFLFALQSSGLKSEITDFVTINLVAEKNGYIEFTNATKHNIKVVLHENNKILESIILHSPFLSIKDSNKYNFSYRSIGSYSNQKNINISIVYDDDCLKLDQLTATQVIEAREQHRQEEALKSALIQAAKDILENTKIGKLWNLADVGKDAFQTVEYLMDRNISEAELEEINNIIERNIVSHSLAQNEEFSKIEKAAINSTYTYIREMSKNIRVSDVVNFLNESFAMLLNKTFIEANTIKISDIGISGYYGKDKSKEILLLLKMVSQEQYSKVEVDDNFLSVQKIQFGELHQTILDLNKTVKVSRQKKHLKFDCQRNCNCYEWVVYVYNAEEEIWKEDRRGRNPKYNSGGFKLKDESNVEGALEELIQRLNTYY